MAGNGKGSCARLVLVAPLLVALGTTLAWGEDARNFERSLKGLPGAMVVVLDSPTHHSTEEIRGFVESRLRAAGITPLKPEDYVRNTALPFLEVRVAMEHRQVFLGEVYDYFVRVALFQEAQLVRNPAIRGYAVTWHTVAVHHRHVSTLFGNRASYYFDTECLVAPIDEFVRAFLSQNPNGQEPEQ